MHLTLPQKRALTKGLTVLLCASLLCGSFLAVPYIAAAIPSELADYLNTSPAEPLTEEFLASLRAGTSDPSSSGDDFSREESSVPTESEPNGTDVSGEESVSAPTPPEDALTVLADTFCWYGEGETPTLDIINRTSYKVDLQNYLARTYPIPTPSDTESEPLVLIVHTHGTESYLPAGVDYYTKDEDFRSTDPEETVVAVGETVAAVLRGKGISVLHDTTMHDLTDFNSAYTYSRASVREYLATYPSIRYVLDIHRDSIFSDDVCEKTLTVIDGTPTAQVMLVVGTDENGAAHSGWRQNLTVATHLADLMNRLYPTLSRPVNLRGDAFNQALSTGCLLVEVGSCGNTIEEAHAAGRMFAESFAALLAEN